MSDKSNGYKKSVPTGNDLAFVETCRKIRAEQIVHADQVAMSCNGRWVEVAQALLESYREDGDDGFWKGWTASANDGRPVMNDWELLVKVAPSPEQGKKDRKYELHPISYLKDRPKKEWGVYQLSYDRGSALWAGDSGSGKSTFVLNVNLSRVCDVNFVGKAVKPGFLIWVGAESVDEIYPRVAAFMACHNLPEEKLRNVLILDEAVPFNNAAEIQDFIASVKEQMAEMGITYQDFQLIFTFDTYARCTPGADENNTQETKVISDTIDLVCSAFNAHVDFIHHTNAQGKIRGSTVFKAGVDTAWVITKDRETMKLECLKMRGHVEPEPFTVLMRSIVLDENNPDETAPVIFAVDAASEANKVTNFQMEILQHIKNLGGSEVARTEVMKACEIDRNTEKGFVNAISGLLGKGLLRMSKEKQRTCYSILESGLAVLAESTASR